MHNRVLKRGCKMLLSLLICLSWTLNAQTDTVHVTVPVYQNKVVDSDLTISTATAKKSEAIFDSSSGKFKVFDTLELVDTLVLNSGNLTLNGKVICNALISKGGALQLDDDTLIVFKHCDLSKISNDTIGGSVIIEAFPISNKNVSTYLISSGKQFRNLTLWSKVVGNDVGKITVAEGKLNVRGNLIFKWNRGPGGANAQWTLKGVDTVTVGGQMKLFLEPGTLGGNSAWFTIGSTCWNLYGDTIMFRDFASSTLRLLGETKQAIISYNGLDLRASKIIHEGKGTVTFSGFQKGFVTTADLIQKAGAFSFEGIDSLTAPNIEILGGEMINLGGKKIITKNATFLGKAKDTLLVLSADAAYKIQASGILKAKYVQLKNCVASANGGAAYSSSDEGGNTNWTFVKDDFPVFTSDPKSVTVLNGSRVTLSVTAVSFGTFKYSWYKNGTLLDGYADQSLSMDATMADSGKTFFAIATDSLGGADTSALCTLKVIDPPRFVSHTAIKQSFTVGSEVSIALQSAGVSPKIYKWYKGQTLLETETDSILSFTTVSKADSGIYKCIITTSNPTYADKADTSGLVYVVVRNSVSILSQPESKNVGIDETVSLKISAKSLSPLSFQWYKAGTKVTGATDSTFTINKFAENDTGSYTCVIGYEDTSITSQAAVITINAVSALLNSQSHVKQIGFSVMKSSHSGSNLIFKLHLPSRTNVSLKLYKLNGQLIGNVVNNANYSEGIHEIVWTNQNKTGVSNGKLICIMKVGNTVIQKSISITN